jgi:hypothetical protein
MALGPDQKKTLLIAGGVGTAVLLGVVLFTKPSRANAQGLRSGTPSEAPHRPDALQAPSHHSSRDRMKHQRDSGEHDRGRYDGGRGDRDEDNERGSYGRKKHRGRHGR